MQSKPGLIQCRRAAMAVLALGAYLEAMEWISLYPWNNIRGGNGQETLDYIIAGLCLCWWRGFGTADACLRFWPRR